VPCGNPARLSFTPDEISGRKVMQERHDLSDEQWARVAPLLPRDMRRRAKWSQREILCSLLWMLEHGGHSELMCGPSESLCIEHLLLWQQTGVMRRICEVLFGESAHEWINRIRERMSRRQRRNRPEPDPVTSAPVASPSTFVWRAPDLRRKELT
jgi:transposase